VRIPRQEAASISKNLSLDPVVYPAVADRVGLLPHPEATVGFYMRIAEAKAMLELLAKPPPVSQTMNVSAPPQIVSPDNAATVADCLITALQLAQPIIADDTHSSERAWLDSMVKQTTLSQITACLELAQKSFPNAESFSNPNPRVD